MKPELPITQPSWAWVQTERKAHEAWADLITRSPIAARTMHMLTAQMGQHNAVVMDQKGLAQIVKCSERGLRDALKLLVMGNWIEVRQIGSRGTVNAYVINDRVAWHGKRDGRRNSLFSAAVIVSEEHQPDRDQLDNLPPLHRLPEMLHDEFQLPTGEGLPPPSEPALPGLEPDLPTIQIDRDED